MTEQNKQPLDAKLLSDAVIELNICRRSVGLYPLEHPISRQSIQNAHGILKRLFEIRSSITLGVAKDVLVVDEYTLDRKNPVYREFAMALHEKGIASVSFYSGLEEKELMLLHELISDKNLPSGEALLTLGQYKKLSHIQLVPLDVSRFSFVKGVQKQGKVAEGSGWEDYVYGLMEGRLAGDDGSLFSIPPDSLASLINSYSPDTEDGYDRVITGYLSKKGRKGLSSESLGRFLALVENLSPEVKGKFLSSAVRHPIMTDKETDKLFSQLGPDDLDRMMRIFHGKMNLPEGLKNMIDKLSDTVLKTWPKGGKNVRFDDIEIDEDLEALFEGDQFDDFISKKYRGELDRFLGFKNDDRSLFKRDIQKDISRQSIDRAFSEVLLELACFDNKRPEDHAAVLDRLKEAVDTFLETGRLGEVHFIYSTMNSPLFGDNVRKETARMMENLFHSVEFIDRLLEAFSIWGREHREFAVELSRGLTPYIIKPLFDALEREERPSQRKFYISLIIGLGRKALNEASLRINDSRWYITRNMVYILRECGGKEFISRIRALTHHKSRKVRLEAVKTLVHFKTTDALSILTNLLKGRDAYLKSEAIKLSGTYRIRESIPYLSEILMRSDSLGSEQQNKVLAVQSLGKIGDPSVLKTLKELLDSKALLYNAPHKMIKLEILKSLVHYPFRQAAPVLEHAVNSGDRDVRSVAREMLSERADD